MLLLVTFALQNFFNICLKIRKIKLDPISSRTFSPLKSIKQLEASISLAHKADLGQPLNLNLGVPKSA